jgi:hypothetical protein
MKAERIDGIIYVSSFAAERIRHDRKDQKSDGGSLSCSQAGRADGEAGYNTRLEAFREVLK